MKRWLLTFSPRQAGAGLAALLFVAGCGAGCFSHGASQYVSPRVEGRVLDRETHQPLAGARVRRLERGQEAAPNDVPHGGEILQQMPAAHSQSDGAFVLGSQRSLALFRKLRWDLVHVTFEHRGYERFTARYTPAQATNTAAGEPVVVTGDILLKPALK
jgi:hypothetical protein